jgi:3-oxoacyl-[acyl-carrier-protein] synthase I
MEIHIVAAGARTPFGNSACPSIAAVRAGISDITEHPFIIDRSAEPVRLAQDTRLDPALMGPVRLTEMVTTAIEEVCGQLAPLTPHFKAIPLFLAVAEERPGWTKGDMQVLSDLLIQRPMPIELCPIDVVPYGHAAGLIALDLACDAIRHQRQPICIIAGVDSYLQLKTLEWLDNNRQLATSYHRGGFFPGESAAAFAVTSEEIVRGYKLDSLAVVRGVGISTEMNRIKTDSICLGEGLTESIRKAAVTLRLPGEVIEGIVCDINGERYRSEEWGFSLLRLSQMFTDPTAYDAPASCWGDMGAASGPLFVNMAVMAGRRGWAKGSRYLIWNSSEHGQRAAVLLDLSLTLHGVA